MAKIITVYTDASEPWELRDMSHIHWLKFSEGLARLGHRVDIATNEPRWKRNRSAFPMGTRLRRVPLEDVRWRDYSVVVTLFHHGFDTLERLGGGRHPFIVTFLGSVVGAEDREGVYFYGAIRQVLYRTQSRIHQKARSIVFISQAARSLWEQEHGSRQGMLIIPGAADAEIPSPSPNPYDSFQDKVCIFSGNIYGEDDQPEANRALVEKLNAVGKRLRGTGIRLVFQGPGDSSKLDPEYVTNLGSCLYEESWRYIQHAAVGLVVSAGRFMHNNESTKIYHYLRAGLPVVSESGFPNDNVVSESGLGFIVPAGDMDQLAKKVCEAANRPWDRDLAIRYIMANHTWTRRIAVLNSIMPSDDRVPLIYRRFRF